MDLVKTVAISRDDLSRSRFMDFDVVKTENQFSKAPTTADPEMALLFEILTKAREA